ncbi:MAG: MFS transporter [Gammaproteobacteria bacterium]|nr:MFS transporter [Gammaproteobacteria bacterium]
MLHPDALGRWKARLDEHNPTYEPRSTKLARFARGAPVAEFSNVYAKRTLLASLVSVGMGFTVLFPVLAPLGREIGLTEIQITGIIAASSLTVFLSSPIWGRVSDVWGRKRVMLVGLFGFTAGTVLFNSVLYAGLSGTLTGWTLFATLVVARMMQLRL